MTSSLQIEKKELKKEKNPKIKSKAYVVLYMTMYIMYHRIGLKMSKIFSESGCYAYT